MTGPEHYREAERLIGEAHENQFNQGSGDPVTPELLSEAHVHAVLALAAATALAGQGEGNKLTSDDRTAWITTASEVPGAAQRRREADAAELAEFAKEPQS